MKLFMKQQVMNKVLYALAPITVFSVFSLDGGCWRCWQ